MSAAAKLVETAAAAADVAQSTGTSDIMSEAFALVKAAEVTYSSMTSAAGPAGGAPEALSFLELRRSSSVHAEAAAEGDAASAKARARARLVLAIEADSKTAELASKLSKDLDLSALRRKAESEDKVVEEASSLLFQLAANRSNAMQLATPDWLTLLFDLLRRGSLSVQRKTARVLRRVLPCCDPMDTRV